LTLTTVGKVSAAPAREQQTALARIQARRAELRPVQGAWGKTPVV